MRENDFRLEITESAYNKLICMMPPDREVDYLPVLTYDHDSGEYDFLYFNIGFINRLAEAFAEKEQQIIFHVGRVNIVIDNKNLLDRVNGKRLDFVDSRFVVTNTTSHAPGRICTNTFGIDSGSS